MPTTKWSEIKRKQTIQEIYNILAYQNNGVPLIQVAETILTYMETKEARRIRARKEIEEAVAKESAETLR